MTIVSAALKDLGFIDTHYKTLEPLFKNDHTRLEARPFQFVFNTFHNKAYILSSTVGSMSQWGFVPFSDPNMSSLYSLADVFVCLKNEGSPLPISIRYEADEFPMEDDERNYDEDHYDDYYYDEEEGGDEEDDH